MNKESTKHRAVQEARSLVQSFGYSGFTFQQVAENLQIRQPSLYQHFKSKEDLGGHLIEDYVNRFREWTEVIKVFDPKGKINALFETFSSFSQDRRKICPLSSLISDYNSLPKPMQRALRKLFDVQYSWLNEVIQEGQRTKIFRKDKSSQELAEQVLSMAFGSQLVARVLGAADKIRELKERVFESLVIE